MLFRSEKIVKKKKKKKWVQLTFLGSIQTRKLCRHSIMISKEVLQTFNDFIEASVLQTVQDLSHKKGSANIP